MEEVERSLVANPGLARPGCSELVDGFCGDGNGVSRFLS
jgi:hypothetical protein